MSPTVWKLTVKNPLEFYYQCSDKKTTLLYGNIALYSTNQERYALDMKTALANILLVIDEAWLDHSDSIANSHSISLEEYDLENFLISSEVSLTGIHRVIERSIIDRQFNQRE
jgi:hypothetical protein